MCVRNMTILSIFLNLASVIFYKTLSKYFRRVFKLCLVQTRMPVMAHIALQTPGRVWIYCLSISRMLQTPLHNPWYFYFSTIVMDYLDPR